jgi:hypothetical protein
MQGMTRAQAARLFMAVFIGIGVWILAVKMGERLPYLITPHARHIRLAILFPALAMLLGWFVFGHRWRETGQTGYGMRMAQLRTKSERVKQTLVLLVGALLLPAGVAWTSIHLAAWAAYFVSSTPYEESYQITEKSSVTGGISFDMYSQSTGEEVSLRAPAKWGVNLRPGMVVYAQGRTSVFGTVIESLEAIHNPASR